MAKAAAAEAALQAEQEAVKQFRRTTSRFKARPAPDFQALQVGLASKSL